jgi:hypothetical protein
MVSSGLEKSIESDKHGQARVAPNRLTAHLGSALIIYVSMLANGIRVLSKNAALKKVSTSYEWWRFFLFFPGGFFPNPSPFSFLPFDRRDNPL